MIKTLCIVVGLIVIFDVVFCYLLWRRSERLEKARNKKTGVDSCE